MPTRPKKTSLTPAARRDMIATFTLDTVVFLVTVALLATVRFFAAPTFGPVTFSVPGQPPMTKTLPAFFDSVAPVITASVTVDLPLVHPTVFAVQVDDCIETLLVNGHAVIPDTRAKLCSPHTLTRLNLGGLLVTGPNTFAMRISDIGVTEGLNITPSNLDPLLLTIFLGLLLSTAWYVIQLRQLLAKKKWPTPALWVFLFGVALRFAYVAATPYAVRAHDTDGHIDYVNYVLAHGVMPHAADGWEFHQPPLYYFLSALWVKLMMLLGMAQNMAMQSIQGWSLALSVAAFGVALLSARFFFAQWPARFTVWFGLIVATFNGVMFTSAGITNETLAFFFGTTTLYFMLRWWSVPDTRSLVALACSFALAFITKISILALLPAIGIIFLVRGGRSWRQCASSILLFAALTIAVAGWYPVQRFFFEPSSEKTVTLGNDGMDAGLIVQRDLQHLVTFNPVALVEHPFNDSWSKDSRRDNFLEYFFRSSLFGEYQFERTELLARITLVLAMLLIPAMLYGIVTTVFVRGRELLPLHLSAFMLALAAFLYPYFFPFAPNQDFRFSALLIIPTSFYVVSGIGLLPRYMRWLWWGILGCFVASCTVFLSAEFFLA